MSSNLNTAVLIIAMSSVTILLRFLPFFIFNNKRKMPNLVLYLGDVLPSAVIGMLVVYSLKDLNISVYPHGLAEILASFVVILLQVVKKNSTISIIFATLTYIVLVNMV